MENKEIEKLNSYMLELVNKEIIEKLENDFDVIAIKRKLQKNKDILDIEKNEKLKEIVLFIFGSLENVDMKNMYYFYDKKVNEYSHSIDSLVSNKKNIEENLKILNAKKYNFFSNGKRIKLESELKNLSLEIQEKLDKLNLLFDYKTEILKYDCILKENNSLNNKLKNTYRLCVSRLASNVLKDKRAKNFYFYGLDIPLFIKEEIKRQQCELNENVK